MTPLRPRNVLFMWTDQQRPDTIGAYGNPQIQTPHLNRLAAAGTLFTQAYSTQPVCSPARASVLTGLYPHTHGVGENNVPLPATAPTLAQLLRPAGYVCGYVGKWHLGRERTPQAGFEDFWVSTEEYGGGYAADDPDARRPSDYHRFLVAHGYAPSDDGPYGKRFSRKTAARLPEQVGKPAFQAGACIRFLETYKERPFLLMCNFLEPHPPVNGPFDGLYDPDSMVLPESWYHEPEPTVPLRYRLRRDPAAFPNHYTELESDDERGWKALKARYWGLCTLVDKYVGRILTRLEELGLAEDTIVAYSSDHGDMMGEHRLLNKMTQYDGAARVPLIVRLPGGTPSGKVLEPRRIEKPVSLVSAVPTLLDLLGLPVPDHVQGPSLVPLLEGGPGSAGATDESDSEANASSEVVIEWNGHNGDPPAIMAAIRSGDPSLDRRLLLADVRTLRAGSWKLNVHQSGEHELYDLQADPGEMHNAFYDPANRQVVTSLWERLHAWQRETTDPLGLPDPTPL